MKPNLVWFDMPALDLDRAIRFYSAVLAAPVKKETAYGFRAEVLDFQGNCIALHSETEA